jgi:WD40 repeat protein
MFLEPGPHLTQKALAFHVVRVADTIRPMSGSAALERPPEWVLQLQDPVASLSWTADSGLIAALTTEGQLTIIDAAKGVVVHEVKAHEGGGFKVAWHPQQTLLASSGQDGQVRLWDGAGKNIESYPGGAAWVEQLAWSPKGDWLASSAGKHLGIWAPGRGVVHQLSEHRSTVTGLCWKSDSSAVAASFYGEVRCYNPDSGRATTSLPWKTSLISVSWSPDGRWIVAGTQELTVQIWELPFRPGDELAMSGYSAKVRELAWHPSGRFLATGGGNEIMVWNCSGSGPAGTTPRILQGHDGRVTALDYLPGGHILASGGTDGAVFFWNAGKLSSPLRQVRLPGPISALKWCPGQSRVAAGTQEGQLAVCASPAT